MKDVIVVSGITHRAHLLDEYEDQLRYAGIDFHLEDISPLPEGIASMTARWRLNYWKRMCQKFSDYDRIVFTDAWDVLFYGAKSDLCAKISPLILSAERNCWPDASLAEKSICSSPWRYPNPGMLAGYPEFIVAWADSRQVRESTMIDAMDQLWFNVQCANDASIAPLDTRTTVFYVASADKEGGELTLRDGKLWNARFGTYPQFVHFAGPCHPSRFRAMLKGEVDAL